MLSFRNYCLNEALTSPVPYYLTDDTVVPQKLYASFMIDDGRYIIAMVQSKVPGVYYMEVGRTGKEGGKVTWWKFHSPKHIIPALSTVVSFSESALELIGKGVFKGVAVKLRKAAANKSIDRAVKIANRIINTKFKSKLNMLPVSQEEGGNKYGDKFIFIARKGQTAANLFSGDKHFAGYDFGKKQPVKAQDIEKAVKPKKVMKPVAVVKPSTKYSFAQYDVDVPASLDQEMLDKLISMKPAGTGEKKAENKKQVPPLNIMYDTALSDGNVATFRAAAVSLIKPFSSMVKSLAKNGFDESKLEWKNLFARTKQVSDEERKLLINIGLYLETAASKIRWIGALEEISKNEPASKSSAYYKKSKQNIAQLLKQQDDKTKSDDTKLVSDEIKPTDFVSTIPGSSNQEADPTKNDWSAVWGLKENASNIARHLYYDMGYVDELPKLGGFSKMKSYTGNTFNSYNNPLRNIIGDLLKGKNVSDSDIEKIAKGNNKFVSLFKMFKDVKPLEKSLWVYRGTYIPESEKEKIVPGYQYVDPAFMSTSTSQNINFGNDKLRIFLPKGSKVLPALYASKHDTEKEVILPPASVIKVIEVIRPVNQNKIFIQGVFTGSAFESILADMKKRLTKKEYYDNIDLLTITERLLEEMKKDQEKEYNPEDKYASDFDVELSDIITDKIEKGEYKVDRPKVEKD